MNQFPLSFHHYEILNLIGVGSTASVHIAKCLKNNQLIAMKIIDLETCPISIESLRAEISFWSISDHPNVVEYYGSFMEGSKIYLLMEYMNSGSCFELMKFSGSKGIPNESYIATILKEILKALKYFHRNKQIHRDVKPGNILLNDKGKIKIADFGISANLVEQGQRKKSQIHNNWHTWIFSS